MFHQEDFGKRLKSFRRAKGFTQKEIAVRIGVSEQAVSKWENGECLPDVYNLKLLGQLLHISVDTLLDTEIDRPEKVIETVRIGGGEFEIVEKPKTILAGKVLYAKDYEDIDAFNRAIDAVTGEEKQTAFDLIRESVLPITDIYLSVNFWLDESCRAYGFVREAETREQPDGIQIYELPASLYIRAYTNKGNAQLIAKEECEIWELFAYIRDFFMPAHGFVMADNGAQEMEVFDSFEHRTGYAYMPVRRRQ